MALVLRPVDPWDEAEMDVLQDLYVEAARAEVPDARLYSRADSVAPLRREGGEVFSHAFAALDDEAMVGQAWVVGNTVANTHVERRQRLPMDEATLSRLEAEAAAGAATYRLQTVVGPIPAELAQGFCDIYNLLNVEMPTGAIELEAARRTPALLADQDEEILEQGRTRVTVLAFAPDGSTVAQTCATTGSVDTGVDQWSTIVRPDHRGHRLGLAVKTALTRTLQEGFPDHTYVRTQNAETNAPMVAINEAMGFEVHTVEGEFQHRLT